MDGLLMVVWLLGTAGAIYFIVRPKPEWRFVSNRGRAFGLALTFFFGAPIIAITLGAHESRPDNARTVDHQDSIAAVPSLAANSTSPATAAEKHPTTNWTYSEDVDQMRGTKTRFASIDSENELQFGFPYDGGKATLGLRQRPSDDLTIYVHIKAQFLCNQFNDETVAVKFDNLPIENYSCGEPSDGSTGFLFIRGGTRFVAHLKKAKTLILEAPFYQAGRKQMEFDVGGLVWK